MSRHRSPAASPSASARAARWKPHGAGPSTRSPIAVPMPLPCEAPAALVVAPGYVEVGTTRVAVAEGRVDLVKLVVDEGRITTQGSFTGVPVTAAARLAGTTLPFPTTMVVGGDWSLAAAPRLNGTAVACAASAATGSQPRARRSSQPTSRSASPSLDVTARFTDDALAASAQLPLHARRATPTPR